MAVGLHASGWDGPNRTQRGFKKEAWESWPDAKPHQPQTGLLEGLRCSLAMPEHMLPSDTSAVHLGI